MDQGPAESPALYMAKIGAARKGCATCKGPVRIPPAGDPFSQGPNCGRYLCADCWTLYWADHPKDLADEESRQYVREEARQIRLKRGAEVVFEEGKNRVFLSNRGTLVFDMHFDVQMGANEFDPDRVHFLMKAFKAIVEKVPAYQPEPQVSAPLVG